MRRGLRVLCLCIFVSTGFTVVMEPKVDIDLDEDLDSMSLDQAVGTCLSRKIFGTLECINRGALSALQSLNDKDDLRFDDVSLGSSSGQSRELLDLDYDPKNFGNVLKAATRFMERRNMKWDLDRLYPGLSMQVGPALNEHGVLEFKLDERTAGHAEREAGTGRMLMRSLLLPFLLGFKFNLTSLIPLIFGVLFIISKKAFFLAKIAVLLSGFLGWNALFGGGGGGGGGGGHGPTTGNHNGFNQYGFDYEHGSPYRPYKELSPNDYSPYGQHVIREVVNVYGDEGATDQDVRQSKNFAWTSRK